MQSAPVGPSGDDRYDPWEGTERAMEILRYSILARREFSGSILGQDRLVRLFSEIQERSALGLTESAQLEAALAGMDSLANGLLSSALNRSLRRFSAFGLYFAVVSVTFASVGLVAFERAGWWARAAVFFAWLAVALTALSLNRRMKSFVRTLRD